MVKKYFTQLNYTLGNEDTTLESAMVDQLCPKSIFSIAGCGSRAFPLVREGQGQFVIADFSQPQLGLCQLREATYKEFNFQEFLLFWGFPPYGRYDCSYERKKLFSRLQLNQENQQYFTQVFNELSWGALLYVGKWEKTFQILASIMKKIMGKGHDDIFQFHNLEEQVDFYENKFPMARWKSVLFLLGNKSVFNALLYRGDFIKKNVPGTHFDYYFKAFDNLFRNSLVRESFFANLCFYGEIGHIDGCTIEAKEENFLTVKKGLESVKIDYVQGDMVKLVESYEGEDFDFLSLSDVPSYFGGEIEKNFIQQISNSIKKDGIIVLRNYLRIPESNDSGFEDISSQFKELIDKETVQMYQVKILQKK